MPGPQSEYREIGNLYVEATPLLLEIAVRTQDGTIALKREQAFELRDFLNRQFPGELGFKAEERSQPTSAQDSAAAPATDRGLCTTDT